MQCETFDQRLDELLDQRRSPRNDARVLAHANSCLRCRAVLDAHDELSMVLAQLPSPSENRVEVSRRRPAGTIALALVTLICMAMFIYSEYFPGSPLNRSIEQSSRVADRQTRASTDLSESLQGDLRLQLQPRLEHVYLVHQPLLGLRLLSQSDWSETLGEFVVPLRGNAHHLGFRLSDRWWGAVAGEIEPLQASVTSTWNLIRKTLTTGATESSVNG